MFRMFGFLSGVLVATLAIGALMDAPGRSAMLATFMRIGDAATAAVARRIGQTPDKLEPSRDARSAHSANSTGEARPVGNPADLSSPPVPVEPAAASTTASAAMRELPARPSVDPLPQAPRPVSTAPPAARSTAAIATPGWQAVWKTFRSEISAQGFADHLRHTYRAEYRIRQEAPWRYRVEIAYADHRQLSAVLDAFRDDTGFDLAETTP